MHSAPKPARDFSEFYTLCASRKQDPARANLLGKQIIIEAAAAQYDLKATSIKLHELQPIYSATLHPETSKNLQSLYASQVSRQGGQGRSEYDKILVNSKQKHCCFCSYEDPVELDHFLPKSGFPEFSILLINLVPSCHRCNKIKDRATPTSAANSYIHPYYEKDIDFIWLEANLSFDSKKVLTVTYRIIDCLKDSHPKLALRIEHQFNELQLNQRYSAQASGEIPNIQHRLSELNKSAGSKQVKQHLSEEAESREVVNLNSWQSALYRALSLDNQFHLMTWNI